MLRGRQLKLLREYKDIKPGVLAQKLNIDANMLTIYEYEVKPIPQDLYSNWIDILKAL